MADEIDYFIPPEPGAAGVLGRYLTPLPANACAAFIHAYVPLGGLVWDPFCRTDSAGRIAARAGRHALLSDFNPLFAFTVRAGLRRASPRELDRAFTLLAAAPKLQTTLDKHVNNLYATVCPICQAPAIADFFVWSREQNLPVEKEFHCETCGQVRREPASEDDLARLATIEDRGRSYYTLLERLNAAEGPLRPLAERLLDLYTPRNLYALSAIQGKLEVALGDSAIQDVLGLGLLEAMERGSKLHAPDDKGRRPRSALRPPATFVEVNCWAAFAEACSAQRARLEQDSSDTQYLRAEAGGVRAIARSGGAAQRELPPIQVRRDSARRVADELAPGSVHLVLTAPPPVDGGDTLALSYLWAGWLLGKDEARVFPAESLLRPRRADDWAWFLGAMERSLRALGAALSPQGRIIFCFAGGGLSYINVLALAAAAAGLRLEHVAYQPTAGEGLRRPPALGGLPGYYYLRFAHAEEAAAQAMPVPLDELVRQAQPEARAAALEMVRRRGEPCAYVWLHHAMLLSLARQGWLGRIAACTGDGVEPWDVLRRVLYHALERGLHDGLDFVDAGPAPEHAPAGDEQPQRPFEERRGWWWLARPGASDAPLADRLEWAVYTVLSTNTLPTSGATLKVAYALFPGLLTPEPGLVEACLQSYATAASPIHWQLRPEDNLQRRSREHTEMLALLAAVGRRLGFKVWLSAEGRRRRWQTAELGEMLSPAERLADPDILLPGAAGEGHLADAAWYQSERAVYTFEVEWTARLGERVLRRAARPGNVARFIVVPPQRSGLIQAKLDRLPLLRQQMESGGWSFIRYDLLRDFAAEPAHTLADFGRIAGLQPPAGEQGLQLSLL